MTPIESSAYTIGAQTDKGLKRSMNEDAVAVFGLQGTDAAFVVADGMGGLSSGEVASGTTVQIFEETLTRHFTGSGDTADPETALGEAMERANDAVYAEAQRITAGLPVDEKAQRSATPVNPGIVMGTTCVAGIVRNRTLYLSHVGDSRAYRLRPKGSIERLTRDHSYVEDRVRAGDITEQEARTSRFRNMITRAIGIDARIEPDTARVPLNVGDTILICTDGLNTMLEDSEIETLLRSTSVGKATPERAAAILVDAANKKGGSDNTTVVILRFGTPAPGEFTGSSSFSSSSYTTPPITTVPLSAEKPTNGSTSNPIPASNSVPNSTTSSSTGSSTSSATGSSTVMPQTGETVNRSRPRRPADVLDLDAKPSRRRKKETPIALVLLSTIGVLALAGAFSLFLLPGVRHRVAVVLDPVVTTSKVKDKPVSDFTNLNYAAPVDFASYRARTDVLLYAPGTGLYFAADISNRVVALGAKGQPIEAHAAAVLAPQPPTPNPIPDNHIFLATDPQGNLYISRTNKKVIEKYNKDGQLLRVIKGFQRPEAIAVDENGNLYVVDFNIIKMLRAIPAQSAPVKK